MKKQTLLFIQALLNSYSILFFSQSNVLAVLLLAASFFNPLAGAAGLFAVCFSLAILKLMHYREDTVQSGLYTFNNILLGIGFGSFFHFNAAFCIWLLFSAAITTMLTVILTTGFAKRGLPALSLPFVLVFWLVLLATGGYGQIGILPKESYMLNELSVNEAAPSQQLFASLNNAALPCYVRLFFRAVSAVLFQDNVFAGVVITIGVLIHSRISFSLLVIGFITACLFNSVTHIYPDGLGHYHLGLNFMLTAMALGGFFTIPSWRSYLLAVLVIPVSFLAVAACSTLLAGLHLPVLSLPFCLLMNGALYFLSLRTQSGKLQLVGFQNYSPEKNLYQYLNNRDRINDLTYLKLSLPFMGEWTVSQGYEGGITHKAGWGQALDFVIVDEDKRTFRYPAERPEDFYCFGKPVLACADGVVETVVNHIEDNRIGEVNTLQNWGNTIIIKHAEGLYSKLSHMKQHSVKVQPGDVVRRGDILGLCGNSGRSPEPHLHFQMQAGPYIGSKTIAYPFAYFKEDDASEQFKTFSVPAEGSTVSNIDSSSSIKQAFSFTPGYVARVTNGISTETWEVFTDPLNQTYLYDEQSGDIAYFISGDSAFRFTAFYGGQSSLLYKFYLAAYKVVFSADDAVRVQDSYPVNITGSRLGLWLHDVIAPFRQFIKRKYSSSAQAIGAEVIINAEAHNHSFVNDKLLMKAQIRISNDALSAFSIQMNGVNTEVIWQA